MKTDCYSSGKLYQIWRIFFIVFYWFDCLLVNVAKERKKRSKRSRLWWQFVLTFDSIVCNSELLHCFCDFSCFLFNIYIFSKSRFFCFVVFKKVFVVFTVLSFVLFCFISLFITAFFVLSHNIKKVSFLYPLRFIAFFLLSISFQCAFKENTQGKWFLDFMAYNLRVSITIINAFRWWVWIRNCACVLRLQIAI